MSRALDHALEAAGTEQLHCQNCKRPVPPYEFPVCDECCDRLLGRYGSADGETVSTITTH